MANFQNTFTQEDMKNNLYRQLSSLNGGFQGSQMGMFNMGQVPQQQGLFSGLSAYNPEWLKSHGQSGAMPYAQFAADEMVRTSEMRNPGVVNQEMANQLRQQQAQQSWLQQLMQQQQMLNRQNQGNGGA